MTIVQREGATEQELDRLAWNLPAPQQQDSPHETEDPGRAAEAQEEDRADADPEERPA